MNGQAFSKRVTGAMLIVLLLVGCTAPAAIPLPPTVTSVPTAVTSVSPTAPPTQVFTLATSIKDVVGSWYSGESGYDVYLRFSEDGTLLTADSLDGLDSQPYATADIQFEGTQMSLKETAVSGVPSCGDALGIYEIRLLPDGKIAIVTIEDECPPRAGDTALEFEPVR